MTWIRSVGRYLNSPTSDSRPFSLTSWHVTFLLDQLTHIPSHVECQPHSNLRFAGSVFGSCGFLLNILAGDRWMCCVTRDTTAPLSGLAECQLHLLCVVITMDRIRPRFHKLPLFFLPIMSLLFFLNLVVWVRRYQLWHFEWVLAWYQHPDWNNQFCPSRGQFLLRLQHPIKTEANARSVFFFCFSITDDMKNRYCPILSSTFCSAAAFFLPVAEDIWPADNAHCWCKPHTVCILPRLLIIQW